MCQRRAGEMGRGKSCPPRPRHLAFPPVHPPSPSRLGFDIAALILLSPVRGWTHFMPTSFFLYEGEGIFMHNEVTQKISVYILYIHV